MGVKRRRRVDFHLGTRWHWLSEPVPPLPLSSLVIATRGATVAAAVRLAISAAADDVTEDSTVLAGKMAVAVMVG